MPPPPVPRPLQAQANRKLYEERKPPRGHALMSVEAVFVHLDLLDLKDQARTSSNHAIPNQAGASSCFLIRLAR